MNHEGIICSSGFWTSLPLLQTGLTVGGLSRVQRQCLVPGSLYRSGWYPVDSTQEWHGSLRGTDPGEDCFMCSSASQSLATQGERLPWGRMLNEGQMWSVLSFLSVPEVDERDFAHVYLMLFFFISNTGYLVCRHPWKQTGSLLCHFSKLLFNIKGEQTPNQIKQRW